MERGETPLFVASTGFHPFNVTDQRDFGPKVPVHSAPERRGARAGGGSGLTVRAPSVPPPTPALLLDKLVGISVGSFFQ